MRLPGEEETGEKMRLSVYRKWLFTAAAASVSVNSNKKLLCECHCRLFLLSKFSKWSGKFQPANVYSKVLPRSAKEDFPAFLFHLNHC